MTNVSEPRDTVQAVGVASLPDGMSREEADELVRLADLETAQQGALTGSLTHPEPEGLIHHQTQER